MYSYKMRLLPTKEQEILISKHFGCTRFVYNHFLDKKIKAYKNKEKFTSAFDMQKELTILKKEHTWLKEVNSQSIANSPVCLISAYERFFDNCKKKKKGNKGFPKFKKKHKKKSFYICQGVFIVENKLRIPKFLEGIKFIKNKIKNKLTNKREDVEIESKIKFATISQNKSGEYFVSVTVERNIEQLTPNDKAIGIDLNVKEHVDSNGHGEPNPLPMARFEKRLKLLNQRLSRSVKGSKGREKARKALAKLYQRIHNIREDHLHKLSRKIVNENQVICVESLSVEEMLKKTKPEDRKETRRQERKRHKDIADAGFYSFVQKLEYKSKWYGRELIKISKWFPSSKQCSDCGWKNADLKPHDREWLCLGCFTDHNRDQNAAKNILAEGLRIRSEALGARVLAVCPDVRPANSGLLVGTEALIHDLLH